MESEGNGERRNVQNEENGKRRNVERVGNEVNEGNGGEEKGYER